MQIASTVVLLASTSLIGAVSILYPSLGETFTELSGVYNIGLEGIMLISGTTSVIVTTFTGNLIDGLLAGLMSGILIGLLLAVFALIIKADQIIFGLGIILLGPFFSYFLIALAGGAAGPVATLPTLQINIYPLNILLRQNALFYAAFALAFFLSILFSKTKFGLAVRALGENARIADSAGIRVVLIRTICCIVGCAIASLGGVFLTIGLTGTSEQNFTAGRGFIAIAMTRVGLFKPKWIIVASVLFGVIDSIQLRLQSSAGVVPYQFLQMLPYFMGIGALILSGRMKVFNEPADLGNAFVK